MSPSSFIGRKSAIFRSDFQEVYGLFFHMYNGKTSHNLPTNDSMNNKFYVTSVHPY